MGACVCSSERSVFIIDIICYDARCTHTLLFSCFYSKIHSLALPLGVGVVLSLSLDTGDRKNEKRVHWKKLAETEGAGMKDDQEMNMQSFVFSSSSFKVHSLFLGNQPIA